MSEPNELEIKQLLEALGALGVEPTSTVSIEPLSEAVLSPSEAIVAQEATPLAESLETPEKAVKSPIIELSESEPEIVSDVVTDDAIAEQVVAQLEVEQTQLEEAICAQVEHETLVRSIYGPEDPEPAQNISPPEKQDAVKPEKPKRQRKVKDANAIPAPAKPKPAHFELDDVSLTALKSAVSDDLTKLRLETDEPDPENAQPSTQTERNIQAFATANKKQKEAIANLFSWLGGGKLRVFTQQALDALIAGSISRVALREVYRALEYSPQTVEAQVSKYWHVLQLTKCATIEGDSLVLNPKSLIVEKRRAELNAQ